MNNKENLDNLIGTWNSTGKVVADGEQHGVEIKGTDRYEWLGDKFVVHYVDVMFGNSKQKGIEIFQLNNDGFDMTSYNNDGSVEKMKGKFDDEGVYRAGDDKVRTTLRIEPNGTEMNAIWEMNQNGTWTGWMSMSFKKQTA